MEAETLWKEYPRLFHMAAAGSWPSIRKHGLLSTSALLDLFQVTGRARTMIECRHRPESVTITHPELGSAIIRDQKPMSDAALRRCLRGVTLQAWYQFLNRHVYFWPVEERLERLLDAKAYRHLEHVVLTLDTKSLVTACRSAIRLSPINSGSTMRNPQPRGPKTFIRIADYPFEERRRLRGRRNAIAELATGHSVPDIARHVLVVERRVGTEAVETMWRRDQAAKSCRSYNCL